MDIRSAKSVFLLKNKAMNEQNLIPNSQRTPSELRKMAQNGGIKSGEVRRHRKSLRESIMEAADMVAALSDAEKQALIEQGYNPDDVTNRARFVAALWAMAGVASKEGNADRRLLMDASGEMVTKMEMQMSPKEYLASVREMRKADNDR